MLYSLSKGMGIVLYIVSSANSLLHLGYTGEHDPQLEAHWARNLPHILRLLLGSLPLKLIIQTIHKHIVAEEPLSSACVGVGVDESANLGIVITGLQVIEPGLCWVIVAIGPFSGIFSPAEKPLFERCFRLKKPYFF